LDALVRAQLDARQVARQERDFERADEIRDQLTAVGIEITDTQSGAQWSLARPTRASADSTDSLDSTNAALGAEKARG
ncbi:MAG: cysteine--tRNA ligase, partial [Terrabacter sp.]